MTEEDEDREEIDWQDPLLESQKEWESDKLLSRDQLRNIEAPSPLIHGNILYKGTISWLVGDSGTYKSFIALDWALSIAMGVPWLGRQAEQGKVLYLVGEGLAGTSKRIDAWEDRHRIEVDDQFVVMRGSDLLNATIQHHLVEAIKRHEFCLFVVDTQARATPNVNENAKDEIDPFIQLVGKLASENQCSVLTIHHSSKAGSPVRGSGSIYGAADTIHILSRPENTQLQAELLIEKQKDTESGETIQLDLTPTLDSLTVDPGVDAEAESYGFHRMDDGMFNRLVHAALFQLSEVGAVGLTKSELREAITEGAEGMRISCSKRDAYRVIDHVVSKALADHMGGSRATNGAIYGGHLVLNAGGRAVLSSTQSSREEDGEES